MVRDVIRRRRDASPCACTRSIVGRCASVCTLATSTTRDAARASIASHRLASSADARASLGVAQEGAVRSTAAAGDRSRPVLGEFSRSAAMEVHPEVYKWLGALGIIDGSREPPPPGRSGKVALDERVATDFENGQVRRTAVPAARSPVSSRPTIPRRNARNADPRGGHHRASRHPPAFAATPPAHRDEVFPASPLPRDARDASPLASSHSRLTRMYILPPPPRFRSSSIRGSAR